jgi:gamma-glutamylaminecyclotransferase
MAAARAFAMPAAVAAARGDTGVGGSHRVFVYGTLKRGFYNHRLLESSSASFVAEASTRRPMRLVLGEYGVPYLMKDEDASTDAPMSRVPGELWVVDDEGLDALDVLEGVSVGMYERVTLEVRVAGERKTNGTDETSGATAFGYVAGAESIARGIGSAGCETIQAYDLETHERAYVPKRDRPATSLGARTSSS